ncbi:MAG: hypothetical protein ACUVQG_00830 [Thermogutta sp.]
MKRTEKTATPLEIILGYLNFSQGVREPQFFAAWNQLWVQPDLDFLRQPQEGASHTPQKLDLLRQFLEAKLAQLCWEKVAFSDTTQAEFVLKFLFCHLIPGYREFHRDILGHLSPDDYCHPFLLGRFCEGILAESSQKEISGSCDTEQLLRGTIKRLNDYLGYRPVPTLEGEKRHKPYDHEFVCPIPLWIRGAGAAEGRYKRLVETAVEILKQTSPELCRASFFDLDQLDEICLDPRGYDMEHPVHQRPNYLYGLWDPRKLNTRGYYCRFILHDVQLDGIMSRIEEGNPAEFDERLFEGAAVLAGTILMASGISGDRPGAILSSVQIDKWLQGVALVRDQFYVDLLGRCTGKRRERLEKEMRRLRQPFGATRQGLNQTLAAHRSRELYTVALANCFAKMGAVEEARQWIRQIHSGAARIRCEIRCLLSECEWLIRTNRLTEALQTIATIIDLIHRGIECGALIDPWYILGFSGFFPIFEHLREGILDHRVEQLITLVRLTLQRLAALRRATAASGDDLLDEEAAKLASDFADWWDQFATTTVSDVNSFVGRDECAASTIVNRVLKSWRKEQEAAQGLGFWKQHSASLNAPASYALLVETLLQHHDAKAAMALLVDWASRAEEVGLGSGEQAFQVIALRWFQTIWTAQKNVKDRWSWTQKFIDYLEANCESLFHVSNLSELLKQTAAPASYLEKDEEDQEDLWSAAYEGVIFRDSANDGYEGATLDDLVSDFELSSLFNEISDRCSFLSATMLIRYDALLASFHAISELPDASATLATWYQYVRETEEKLLQLALDISRYPLTPPNANPESMMEFERRCQIRDFLVERVVHTAMDALSLRYLIKAVLDIEQSSNSKESLHWDDYYPQVLRAVLYGDETTFHELMKFFPEMIESRPILYASLMRGGDPRLYFTARGTHRAIGLLAYLMARQGWAGAMIGLLTLVKNAEQKQAEGGGKISEIEHLFEAVADGIFSALIASEQARRRDQSGNLSQREAEHLIEALESVCQVLVDIWATISHEIYLSTVETSAFQRSWQEIRQFIRKFGQEIFTPMFMAHSNLRAIIAMGTGHWLKLVQESNNAQWSRLIEALDTGELNPKKAAEYLRLILEAVIENYEDYLDYNSMTTQSDYGKNLHILIDFLRLKCEYQRRHWMLKPFFLAHRCLIHAQLWDAAQIWEESVNSHFQGWSEIFVKKYDAIRSAHGIHLPGLFETLNNGFGFTLAMQHVLGLVQHVVRELESGQASTALARLTQRIQSFGTFHVRYGFHRPEWIDDLENAIQQAQLNLEIVNRPWEWLRSAWEQAAAMQPTRGDIVKQVVEWGRMTRRSFQILFSPQGENHSQ